MLFAAATASAFPKKGGVKNTVLCAPQCRTEVATIVSSKSNVYKNIQKNNIGFSFSCDSFPFFVYSIVALHGSAAVAFAFTISVSAAAARTVCVEIVDAVAAVDAAPP